jgi:FKBP-type peptidyl-prolyl cis-trans isomerase (trigger factor)
MEQVGESLTEWIITIDGVEADLGRFSDAIYKKMMQDAKQQRFQGFRPGTVPAHVEPTYRAFAMDECARETVLEAMQQNNVRPFDNTRNELLMEDFRVPPPQNKKKGKKGKKPKVEEDSVPSDEIPQWASFPTMKEAISAGWRPGQSFSFVAKNCKGQLLKDESETNGATPLGLNF